MPDPMKARIDSLTRRQEQLLRLISLGCTNAEMAAILGLAENTVDNHRCSAHGFAAVRQSPAIGAHCNQVPSLIAEGQADA